MMNDDIATLWDHVEDLRVTLLKSGWAILFFTLGAFIVHEPVLKYLTQPLHTNTLVSQEIKTHRITNTQSNSQIFHLPTNSTLISQEKAHILLDNTYELSPGGQLEWQELKNSADLLLLSPLEGFTTSLKVSLWLGFVLSSPFWLYFVFQFITPALHRNERALAIPFALLSFLFISCGLIFAYQITIPIANNYLLAFNQDIGLNLWSLSAYIDYTLLLLLANALAFELFTLILLLVHLGVLKASLMQEKRKYVVVAAFILGAILTPPDVISQLLLAIPLVILYEVSILYAKLRTKQSS